MNHTARRLLVLAAAVGLITGLIALSGHTIAVAAHTFGGTHVCWYRCSLCLES